MHTLPGGWWLYNPAGNITIDGNVPGGFSPPSALRYRWPAGDVAGESVSASVGRSDANMRIGGQRPRELFLGYTWRMSDGYRGAAGGMAKTLYVHHGRNNHPGGFWHTTITGRGGSQAGPFGLRLDVYESQPGGGYDIAVLEPNRSGAIWMHRGSTYRHEIYIRAASAPGARDGVVRWWINGALAGEHRGGFAFPSAAVDELNVNPVRGGGGGAPLAVDAYAWFDHIYVSGRR